MGGDFHLFARGLVLSLLAGLLTLTFTYFLPLSDYFSSTDYYVEKVDVTFHPPYLTEEITYRVVGRTFTEMFKVYYGTDPIVDVRCPDKGTPYTREVVDGLEVGCRFEPFIGRGSHTMVITYEVGNSPHIPWVVFNEVPRKVGKVTSNAYVPFSSSTVGEPVMAIYGPTIQDYVYALFVRLFLLLPFLTPVAVVAFLYHIYRRYGQEYPVEEMPDVYHTIPNEARSPMEVALLFSGSPTDASGNAERAINAALAHAVVEGAVEMEGNKVRVVDKEKLEKLPLWERKVVELLEGSPKIGVVKAQSLSRTVRSAWSEWLPKVYDNKGDRVGDYLIVGGILFIFFYFVIPIISILVDALFPVVDPNFRFFIPLSVGMTVTVMGVVFKKFGSYALGRYKSKEIYRERLLWEAFGNLLRDESRMKEYNLEDKHMWGMWIAYAYALGVPEKVIKLMAERARAPSLLYVSRFGRAYAVAMAASSSRGGGARGLRSFGFRGGGRFGMR